MQGVPSQVPLPIYLRLLSRHNLSDLLIRGYANLQF